MSNEDHEPPASESRQKSQSQALLTAGLDHSWKWVEICTNRQAQSFNFFLVLNAFLTGGYIAAANEQLFVAEPSAAAAGVLAAVGFGLQDRRIGKYIAVGEQALMVLEERVGVMIDCSELKMLESVRSSGTQRMSPTMAGYSVAAAVWAIGGAYPLAVR